VLSSKRLDDAVGPGVIDKPILGMPDDEKPSAKDSDSQALRELGAGKYDELFKGAPDKPSELYQAAQTRPPAPTVRVAPTNSLVGSQRQLRARETQLRGRR